MLHKLIKRIIKRLKQKLKTFYMLKIRKFIRISSYPYISGDTFRTIANHIYDEIKYLNYDKIQKKEILFIKTDLINKFIEINQIRHLDNVLIFHNSDKSVEKEHLEKLTNKFSLIFAQNLNVNVDDYKNVFPLPIGFENRSYLMHGRLNSFNKVSKNVIIKTNDKKILCGFNPNTNKARRNILEIVSKSNNIDLLRFTGHSEYLKILSTYKFNLCPEGNGLDTHRFWESLLVETVPIVKRSDFISNFKNLNIPCYVLDNWDELKTLDLNKLDTFYDANLDLIKEKKYIYFDFWKKFILKKIYETL